MAEPVKFTCAGRSDVGIVRSGNEDNFLILEDHALFIVADGMGGHAAGEVASEMAVNIIAEEVGNVRGMSEDETADRMRKAIREANGAIFERTLTEHDKRGMGTTTTVLALNGNRYLIGQVGDSRAYLLREGELIQLTKDHSYVQEQVDAGYLSPEEARTHPYSNVITRCVGANNEVAPDTYAGRMHVDDMFVLVSDGLTGMVDDPDLLRILSGSSDPETLVGQLITEANERGGLDNITVIAVRIDKVGAPRDSRPTVAIAEA